METTLDCLLKAILDSPMTIKEIGRKSGVAEATIRSWLYGQREPGFEHACWVARAVGYSISIEKEK